MGNEQHSTGIVDTRWSIEPVGLPRIVRRCAHCGESRGFGSSGRFRVNANGRKLDVWLVYRCESCERAWKLPVLERCPVGSVEPARLEAFQRNDDRAVWEVAGEAERSRGGKLRLEAAGFSVRQESVVSRAVEGGDGEGVQRIRLDVAPGVTARLDRVLAQGLGLSRAELRRWFERGALELQPAPRTGLRGSARDGQCVICCPPGAGGSAGRGMEGASHLRSATLTNRPRAEDRASARRM